ncbi:MAG: adenylate/guanylate cyclase domain-containing protein [Candidatus Edwardsbacteria bacterium]
MTQKTEERRLITILFADISRFTALSHKLDPEDVQEVANTCFEYLNQPINRQEGTIHKYEGDLVIALFGIPTSHEDDPERAIKAGLEMMGLVPEINETISKRLKAKGVVADLGLHIGINCGTVVAGEVGSLEKKEYTVMGDVVNLASRLKDNAKRGEIIVSEPVFRASRYLFDYKALPPVTAKGIEEPVWVFKPLKIREKPDPKRGIQGLYSPLVGRDKDLESLKQSVKKLEKGRFGAAFILGDAGLGKSRLYEELKKHLISTTQPEGCDYTFFKKHLTNYQSPITILEGRCLSYGDAITYWPFLQILEQIFGITDADSPKIIQEKLLKKARHLFPDDWKEIVPYLGYLFAIRFSDELDEKVKYLEPKDLRIQLFISVRKLLFQISRSQPVLIAIDDCQWIDATSLELIEFIFDSPEPFPLLFLGLARIEKEKPYYKTRENLKKKLADDYLEIILEPLDMDSSAQLTHNLLKVPGFSKKFRDKILAKAEGNPFYLEEILRSLIDSNILIFKSGIWTLSPLPYALSSIQIPDTVQAVIASRLDRLHQDVREVLQMASVMGRSFYVRILAHLGEFEELMLTLYLATLEEFEYIQKLESQKLKTESQKLKAESQKLKAESQKLKAEIEYIQKSKICNLQSEIEYMFRHPLLQEVVYNSLLKKRRKELHRRTGEAIEKIFHNRLDDFAEILAYQYINSDSPEKAIEWQKKAGHKAKERYANDKAIGYFEKVISIIKQQKLVGAIHELPLIDAYEALGDVHNLKAEYEQAIKNYEEMFDNATDKIVKAKARRKIADVCEKQGKYDDALKILESAEQILKGDSIDEIKERAEIHILVTGEK